MGHEGRLLLRASAGGSALALTLGMVFVMSGAAASAAGSVTSVGGSAYGYHSYGVTIFGGAQPDKGPTPMATLAHDASNSPQSASSTSGLVTYGPATQFTSDSISVATSGSLGTSGSVTSSSDVTDINKASTQPGTGSEALTADSISSGCSASTSGSSGSTTVTNGTVVTNNGTNPPTVVNLPTTPAAGYSVTGGVVISSSDTEKFKYVFNERVKSGRSIIVNAVHEYLLGPAEKGNLIIGQVICSTAGTDVSVQNPGITSTPNPVPVGGTVTFTVTVSNLGPNAAPKSVDASSVTGGKISSATASAGSCRTPTLKGTSVRCNLGTIPSGQSVTVHVAVVATISSGRFITITSTVSCPADDNPSNNAAANMLFVVAP